MNIAPFKRNGTMFVTVTQNHSADSITGMRQSGRSLSRPSHSVGVTRFAAASGDRSCRARAQRLFAHLRHFATTFAAIDCCPDHPPIINLRGDRAPDLFERLLEAVPAGEPQHLGSNTGWKAYERTRLEL
ncbi:MAG: hypothetical protein JNN30_17160 [Rhodanobacteraceae bacterium]|nr:hypothetical protein [Rhodanobacteraceae bacterium]